LLLPLAFLLHIAEELWGGEGFPAWTGRLVAVPLGIERFRAINAVGWPAFALLTGLGLRRAWLPVALATMLLTNGVLHLLGTLWTGAYSPGVWTALLLYPPIGVATLRYGRRALSPSAFAGGVLLGVLLHAAVLVIAFG
jgi:hypothetical protein